MNLEEHREEVGAVLNSLMNSYRTASLKAEMRQKFIMEVDDVPIETVRSVVRVKERDSSLRYFPTFGEWCGWFNGKHKRAQRETGLKSAGLPSFGNEGQLCGDWSRATAEDIRFAFWAIQQDRGDLKGIIALAKERAIHLGDLQAAWNHLPQRIGILTQEAIDNRLSDWRAAQQGTLDQTA